MEPEEKEDASSERRGVPLKSDALLFGLLALAAIVAAGFATENQRLRRENQVLGANYAGVVAVLNQRKPCQNCEEGKVNGDTGLHSQTSADSFVTPE